MATQFEQIQVLGLDPSSSMLKAARRLARDHGVADRCTFLKGDALTISRHDLPSIFEDGNGQADIITCALGYSVMPSGEETFRNTLDLLKDTGSYVIFDQYIPGLVLPEFAADQSRRSWELVEEHFVESEVKWFGEEFIAVGHGKKAGKLPEEAAHVHPRR